MNISLEKYLADPCGTSSLPYWKSLITVPPENMLILHDSEFSANILNEYADEPYFRLSHDLRHILDAVLSDKFELFDASPSLFAEHISECYDDISMSESEIETYFTHSVYSPELWIAVRERDGGRMVASGIGEFDSQVGEGILEWIQVSSGYRGCGLGTFVVCGLLRRLAKTANFATVSGAVNNPSSPEKLYRKCGFVGSDVWHILRRKDN